MIEKENSVMANEKLELTSAMAAVDVAARVEKAALYAPPVIVFPALDTPGVAIRFHMGASPEDMRMIVWWPGMEPLEMVASDVLPKDELITLRVVLARAMIEARSLAGAT